MKTKKLCTSKDIKHGGQGMVEFALVLPVLLLLTLGIFEFGRLLFIYSAVNTASSEAVRYGSAVDDTGGAARYADCAGIEGTANRVGSLVSISSITISYDEGPSGAIISSTCPPPVPEDIVGGRDRIKVEVQSPYSPIVPFVALFDNLSFTISADSFRTIIKDIELGEGGAPPGGGGGGGGCDPSVATVDFEADKSQLENTGNIDVAINISGTPEDVVTVEFSVTGGTATGGGDDYTINTSSPITLPGVITIEVQGDSTIEPDETVEITMGTVTCATKGDDAFTASILNDDAPSPDPDVSITSGNSPIAEAGGVSTITASLSVAHASQDVTINFSTGGTAEGDGNDFTLSNYSVIIPQGNLSTTTTVTGLDDADTDDEVVIVSLSSAVNANIVAPSSYSVTITDDDAAPTMHVDDLNGWYSAGKNANFKDANVTIRIVDEFGSPLENALAGGTWGGGGSGSVNCTTNASGECTVVEEDVHKNNWPVTFTVTSVVKATYTYESGDNVETGITINYP